ncbi:MAG: hypothetical protein JST46_12040 [Bacteroidetes bacterium]|nr:hypothetical protein [Bacteroidota bacterium]
MNKIQVVFTFALFLTSVNGIAQSEYGWSQFGIYSLRGTSIGSSPTGSTVTNQMVSTQLGFVAVGAYTFIQLRDDSTYATAGFFRFMRIDLGIASRSGVFEPSPGNLLKLTTGDIDVSALFPLSFPAAKEIDAYCAAGPAMTYQYGRQVYYPAQPPPPTFSNFKYGYTIELGFRLKSGSFISYKTITQFGDFSFRAGAIVLGFSPQIPNRRRKK